MNRRALRRACTLRGVASLENLFRAATLARRGKSRRPDVETWWHHRESELGRLSQEMSAGTWRPGGYRTFFIHEPKRREISAAPFADRVVHHALCLRLAPLLQRRFIARSYSCQVGKGTQLARDCCRQLVNRHRYVLKCDVWKFFPNLDHASISRLLARDVRCGGIMALCGHILASHRTGPELPAALFPGDDLLTAVERPRGLPIGNLTSQLWGNLALDPLDRWITEQQGHGSYLRYTDDFLLFSNDKGQLWDLRAGIVEQLAAVRLRLAEPKSRLLACREGVPFCGFLFRPGLQPRILGATKRRFEARRERYTAERDYARLTQAVRAWYQFSEEANSAGLRRAYATPRRSSP